MKSLITLEMESIVKIRKYLKQAFVKIFLKAGTNDFLQVEKTNSTRNVIGLEFVGI